MNQNSESRSQKPEKNIAASIRAVFTLLLMLTLLLGIVYPLAVLGVAKVLFPARAGGSLIERGGKVIGSSLLGQSFEDPKYFWGRLSATTPPYNASASAASNISPGNPKLLEAANARIAALQKADPGNMSPIPVDLVTASASGLDPHISLEAAQYQAGRVARSRGMAPEAIAALISRYSEGELFGGAYVNVLRLNLALDEKLTSGQ